MKITRPQRHAIYRKFCQAPDGAASYREFRKRARFDSLGGFVALPWCGMWLAIEPDGYTHS